MTPDIFWFLSVAGGVPWRVFRVDLRIQGVSVETEIEENVTYVFPECLDFCYSTCERSDGKCVV